MCISNLGSPADAPSHVEFSLQACPENGGALCARDIRFFDTVAIYPTDRGATSKRIVQIAFKERAITVTFVLVRAEFSAAAQNTGEAWIECVVQASEDKMRCRIQRSVLVTDNFESVISN